ncbi:MAG: tetratricopeptide repeat protein [Labilithrix sp.]|nr:tetratricopeptide repeat protein [Labilithrix sp.]MBX3224857.1 tetratricopeptide repeat protein [Labilithrix sp.]
MTTPRDPLATALRDALASESTSPAARADDDALIARAVARATSKLAAGPAAASASESARTGSSASKAAANASRSSAPKTAKVPAAQASATDSARLLAVAALPRARILRVMLPLAAAFAASIATAAVYVSRSSEPEPPPAPVEAPEPPPAAPEGHAKTSTIMPAESRPEPSVSVHDLPSAKPLAAVTSDTVAFSPPPPADSPVTAAELFREANAERRAGNLNKAVDQYRALQKRYPDAPETQASRVSLGRLLLDRHGDASGALAQFEAYLAGAQADGGTLAEEARLGRALAFEKLGRRDDERRALEELLVRHPHSLHGSRARERLDVIGSTR